MQSKEHVRDVIGVTDQIFFLCRFAWRSSEVLGDEGKPWGHHSTGGKFPLLLQKMRISWMFMCLLVCKSSYGTQDQSDSKCDWRGKRTLL